MIIEYKIIGPENKYTTYRYTTRAVASWAAAKWLHLCIAYFAAPLSEGTAHQAIDFWLGQRVR